MAAKPPYPAPKARHLMGFGGGAAKRGNPKGAPCPVASKRLFHRALLVVEG